MKKHLLGIMNVAIPSIVMVALFVVNKRRAPKKKRGLKANQV